MNKYSNKKKVVKDTSINIFFKKLVTKIMICIILFLAFMICIKKVDGFDKLIYEHVYNKSFSFAKINSLYTSLFGNLFPQVDIQDDVLVSGESLVYKDVNTYKDGVILTVDDNYLVPFLKDGIVVFIGEKEGYGNVLIVEDEDNVDIWYCNITNSNINFDDYVKKGDIVGNVLDNKLIMVFKKDGEQLDYKEYI